MAAYVNLLPVAVSSANSYFAPEMKGPIMVTVLLCPLLNEILNAVPFVTSFTLTSWTVKAADGKTTTGKAVLPRCAPGRGVSPNWTPSAI